MPSPTTRSNRHRVQRQIVDLVVGRTADSESVYRELARPFWDRTALQLEHVFDRVAGPHERVRLDRVEVNLGTLVGADWTTELRRRLVAELARSLAQWTSPEHAQRELPDRVPPAEPWEQFLFFLVHGRLPWWGGRPAQGWTRTLLLDADGGGWSALRETIAGDPRACQRFVHSVDDECLEAVVRRWSGLLHAARALERLMPDRLRAGDRRRWRDGFWMLVLEWVFAGGFGAPAHGPLLVRDLRDLLRRCATETPPGASRGPLFHDSGAHGRVVGTARPHDLPDPWGEWLQEPDALPFDPASGVPVDDVGALGGGAPSVVRLKARAALDNLRRTADEEGIFLGGAGAVLLHPFLEQLFRDRGLLVQRRFRDQDARERAVHLVGLLTFGREAIPEFDMLIAKLLCGVEFEEPLPPSAPEEEDHAACADVLRAVLEHWTALRSSSPEWLRQQFLLRDGKVERLDAGFRVTVERRAQDVLLGRLPWGIGVIALPWLNDRIFVHWMD